MSTRGKGDPNLRCAACRMHRDLCICALLPRVVARTRVVLVVHQLEAPKPTNTAVVAARCLPNSAVVFRGRAPDAGAGARGATGAALVDEVRALAAPGSEAIVLYPQPDAIPIDAWRGAPVPPTLIVPDGTWRQAARARARLAAGGLVRCARLPADAVAAAATRTRMRAPAHPERLATLEAVAIALGVLEGPAAEAALLGAFRVMTERKLWTNGRLAADEVTGGIPFGARAG